MLVLGIESTCDETGCAIVRNGKEILSNVVSSQADLHRVFGGVVPELACRRHVDVLTPVLDEAIREAGVSLRDIDAIAVAHGPGLIGAILIGLNAAKGLALALNKPLIGVNHVEAHLYAAMMSADRDVDLPALGVVISGGHTALLKISDLGQYEMIGQTVDDALGEAFDKVAKILEQPYPGGPHIERMAKQGDASRFTFSTGRVKGRPFHFSYSGIKTGVLYAVKGQNLSSSEGSLIKEDEKVHVAAAFQETVFQDLKKKIYLAAEQHGCRSVLLGGGVANNGRLREILGNERLPIHWPPAALTLDNAAMIAGLGYHKTPEPGLDLEACPRLPVV